MKKEEFNNWGFQITEQSIEICDAWLKFKGYECIEAWAEEEVVPNEDAEFRLGYLEGSIGYEEYYLYENLLFRHLYDFTITKANFLDFYFNSGDDGSQHKMREDLGYKLVDSLLDDRLFVMPTAEDLLESCGYIRLSDCEEVTEGHPLEDLEDGDIDWDIEIKII